MKIINLIKWDMNLQARSGIYFLYFIMTCVYLMIISALPHSIREIGTALIIYSDPAALGLFFMGAIILLEKSQRVVNAFNISPVKPCEYVISKVLSLSIVSTIVAAILAAASDFSSILRVVMGVIPGSVIFTLVGIIMASRAKGLNNFVFLTIPCEIILFIPAAALLIWPSSVYLRYYPMNMVFQLLTGRSENLIITIPVLVILILILFQLALKSTVKMWHSLGGGIL